jgi:hypothetical protein
MAIIISGMSSSLFSWLFNRNVFIKPTTVLEILTLTANKIKRNIKKVSHDSFRELTWHLGIDIYVGLLQFPKYFGIPLLKQEE